MALPVLLTAGRALATQGARWLVTTPAGVTITSLSATALLEQSWDWMFGTPEEKARQESLVREMYEVRSRLNDPTTPPDQMQMLADRDSQIQNELAELGLNVTEELGQPEQPTMRENYTPAVVADVAIDSDGNGEYTLSDISIATDALALVSNYMGIQQRNLPKFISAIKTLMQLSEAQMKVFIKLTRGG
jgi:hypothetical protein